MSWANATSIASFAAASLNSAATTSGLLFAAMIDASRAVFTGSASGCGATRSAGGRKPTTCWNVPRAVSRLPAEICRSAVAIDRLSSKRIGSCRRHNRPFPPSRRWAASLTRPAARSHQSPATWLARPGEWAGSNRWRRAPRPTCAAHPAAREARRPSPAPASSSPGRQLCAWRVFRLPACRWGRACRRLAKGGAGRDDHTETEDPVVPSHHVHPPFARPASRATARTQTPRAYRMMLRIRNLAMAACWGSAPRRSRTLAEQPQLPRPRSSASLRGDRTPALACEHERKQRFRPYVRAMT